MATWLIPALKAVLPHLGTIISAAAPAFTRKKSDQAVLLADQVAELQAASSQNAAHIRELAAQLQGTVAALEQAAASAQASLRRIVLCCIAAALLSAGALGLALYVILAR